MMLTLADTIEALTGSRPAAPTAITEASVDSRQAVAGSLFVAIPGEHLDGHDFLKEAFARGAAFALIQRDVEPALKIVDLRPGASAPSHVDLAPPLCLRVDDSLTSLQQIARFCGASCRCASSASREAWQVHDQRGGGAGIVERYKTLRNPGNLNNEIGLPLTMLRLNGTHERAVLEMGFYVPGEIEFLCEIALPHVGVVTNIGSVHAERAGSREEIARARRNWFRACPCPGGRRRVEF